jgi:hypothetical protein
LPRRRRRPYTSGLARAAIGTTWFVERSRLIVIRTGRSGEMAAIGVIENWFAEFKDRP